MGDRLYNFSSTPPARILTLPYILLHGHDPIKSPIQTIHQHVAYASRNTRKHVSSGLHESEVRFLDLPFLELDLKLACL